jgi:DNA-binding MarR family transcriptional regulator
MEMQRLANLVGALALTLTDRMVREMCKEAGLPESSVSALIVMHQRPAVNVDGVARVLNLAHSSTVRLINRLENAGLVSHRSGADRRNHELLLTHDGEKLVDRMLYRREQTVLELLQRDHFGEVDTSFVTEIERLLSIAACDPMACARICRLCNTKTCDLTRCPVELAEVTIGSL